MANEEDELLRCRTFDTLEDTVAILGAGFSMPAGIPPTSLISRQFLTHSRDWPTPRVIQDAISRHLGDYWRAAFDYKEGIEVPTFEDHFTLLDLSANSGHNLGSYYTPAMLRALRRMSIHRVFDILDSSYQTSQSLATFLDLLSRGEESSVISLNWDIVVENHLESLGRQFRYDTPGEFLDHREAEPAALPLVKLHGSANWLYCDSCHYTHFGTPGTGKTALHDLTFLQPGDFRALGDAEEIVDEVTRHKSLTGMRSCRRCGAPQLGARVATFSYAKAYGFLLFQSAWDAALRRLMNASQWIFVGYSLPEADFEFRHLLKVAQMNSAQHGPKRIWVVIQEGTDLVARRYRRFFGLPSGCIDSSGIEAWVTRRISAATP